MYLLVCLSVCLSVRSHISNATSSNFATFSVHVTCDRSFVARSPSDRNVIRYVFLVLVDDVVFLHNGWNRPESKTTSMFRPIRQMAVPVGRQSTLFGGDGQLAAPGQSLSTPTA